MEERASDWRMGDEVSAWLKKYTIRIQNGEADAKNWGGTDLSMPSKEGGGTHFLGYTVASHIPNVCCDDCFNDAAWEIGIFCLDVFGGEKAHKRVA